MPPPPSFSAGVKSSSATAGGGARRKSRPSRRKPHSSVRFGGASAPDKSGPAHQRKGAAANAASLDGARAVPQGATEAMSKNYLESVGMKEFLMALKVCPDGVAAALRLTPEQLEIIQQADPKDLNAMFERKMDETEETFNAMKLSHIIMQLTFGKSPPTAVSPSEGADGGGTEPFLAGVPSLRSAGWRTARSTSVTVVMADQMRARAAPVFKFRPRRTFQNDQIITQVELPMESAEIVSAQFAGCTSLERVTVESFRMLTASACALHLILRQLERILPPGHCDSIKAATSREVESSDIGEGAFRGCFGLKEVTCPRLTKAILKNAFERCVSLERITFPYALKSIGNSAFRSTSSLKHVSFNNLDSIGSEAFAESGVEAIDLSCCHRVTVGSSAFAQCVSLASVRLPGTAVLEGESTFADCPALRDVTLGNGLSRISPKMFKSTAITAVTLPETAHTVCEKAFADCADLVSVEFHQTEFDLGKEVFSRCKNLRKVTFRGGETSAIFGEAAFWGCTSLDSIILANAGKHLADVTLPDGITIIRSQVFCGCSALKSVHLPPSVTTIERAAFNGCSSLAAINVPSELVFIGDYAFSECSALDMELPPSLTYVGNEAFAKCTALRTITIPTSLLSIGLGAFRECTSLSAVTAESRSKSLHVCSETFLGCTALKKVDFASLEVVIAPNAFDPVTEVIKPLETDTPPRSRYTSASGVFKRKN
eukprot:m.413050 g.413050  ORF g.413050 m.413050 type:complete len:716 (-) comp16822_c1_seq32:93-2240(-)